jgi:hypothetical protein
MEAMQAERQPQLEGLRERVLELLRQVVSAAPLAPLDETPRLIWLDRRRILRQQKVDESRGPPRLDPKMANPRYRPGAQTMADAPFAIGASVCEFNRHRRLLIPRFLSRSRFCAAAGGGR